MSTFLFDKIIFGPVNSRRLGVSLGINLLPADGKLCSFDCIYCECGLNKERKTKSKMPQRADVRTALDEKLRVMQQEGTAPDVITFAGNGEPTMHPEFAGIIDDTINLRNHYFPQAKIAVLSNSTQLFRPEVFQALNKIEDNILKLDSISDSRIQQLNVPNSPTFNFKDLMSDLCRFEGNLIIQTMFIKGEANGESITNTTDHEIEGWLEALQQIRPKQVMIYTIARNTPLQTLKKVPAAELDKIADKARKLGFDVSVSY